MRSLRTVQNTWVDVWKLLAIEVCNYHNYHHDLILTSTAICHKHGRENPTCTSRDARLLWMKKNTENTWHARHGQLSSMCGWHPQIHQVSNMFSSLEIGPNNQTTDQQMISPRCSASKAINVMSLPHTKTCLGRRCCRKAKVWLVSSNCSQKDPKTTKAPLRQQEKSKA